MLLKTPGRDANSYPYADCNRIALTYDSAKSDAKAAPHSIIAPDPAG
jgi:hypothetical protein